MSSTQGHHQGLGKTRGVTEVLYVVAWGSGMGLKILSQPLLNLSDSLMKLLHKTVISVFGGHIVISVCLAVCESCAGKLTLLSSFH